VRWQRPKLDDTLPLDWYWVWFRGFWERRSLLCGWHGAWSPPVSLKNTRTLSFTEISVLQSTISLSPHLKPFLGTIPETTSQRVLVLVVIKQTDRRTVLESGHSDEHGLKRDARVGHVGFRPGVIERPPVSVRHPGMEPRRTAAPEQRVSFAVNQRVVLDRQESRILVTFLWRSGDYPPRKCAGLVPPPIFRLRRTGTTAPLSVPLTL
jgi:hypothetical protein